MNEEESVMDWMLAEYKERYMRPAYQALRKVEKHFPSGSIDGWLPTLVSFFRFAAPSEETDATHLGVDQLLGWLSNFEPPRKNGAPIHPRALTAALKLWLLIPPRIATQDEVKDELQKCKHQTKVELATARRGALERARKRVYKVRKRWSELGHPTLLESLLSQYGQDAFECVECHPIDAGSYEILPRHKLSAGEG